MGNLNVKKKRHHKIFKAPKIKNKTNVFLFALFNIASVREAAYKRYKILHTIGNTIAGGCKSGFFNIIYQVLFVSVKSNALPATIATAKSEISTASIIFFLFNKITPCVIFYAQKNQIFIKSLFN